MNKITFENLWRGLIGELPTEKTWEAKQAEYRKIAELAGYDQTDLTEDQKADLLAMYQNEQI